MKKLFYLSIVTIIFVCGCDSLRLAPGEAQKQNAWLHNRTAQVAADMAVQEDTSEKLRSLAALSELQSRAFCADYGLPNEFPPAENADDILKQASVELAGTAVSISSRRPDAWQVADGLIEFGIGIAGLLGGAYGVQAAKVLRQAGQRTKALREIVEGNEIFKKQSPDSAAVFKSAQQSTQSPQTRQIVSEIRNS